MKVYIASPYIIGDREQNVRRSLDAAHELITKGFVPYAPLLWHYAGMSDIPEQTFLSLDRVWLAQCDCVLRLEGESRGADAEVELAHQLGMKVFGSVEDICRMVHEYAVQDTY